MKRGFILAAVLSASPLAWEAEAQEAAAQASATNALALLQQGNARFVSDRLQTKDFTRERPALVKEQHPYAIVLTCADSRLAPEILFDQSLGKLFVVRVAGNVADPVVLGSIEYAAEHLHTRLLLVLGHDSCGAVQAALAGGHASKNLELLVHEIVPAAEEAKHRGLDAPHTLDAAVRENVQLQSRHAVADSPLLAELVEKKQLQVVGAVYHLDSWKVEILPDPKQQKLDNH